MTPPLKNTSTANAVRSASRCARNSICVAGTSSRNRHAVDSENNPISASTAPIGNSGIGMARPQCSQAIPAAQPASSDTRTAINRPNKARAGRVESSVEAVVDGMVAL